ncbi:MAG: zinc ribbon domain-containing protein [Planctomycetes bacterium]|nr:zinc ribbon domain-containing protein [Planctomycetota bacterium]
MFDFCPHCGQTLEHEQVPGRMLVCAHCGQDIGFVGAVARTAVDEANELIRAGSAARCPSCQQLVEIRPSGDARKFVPHYAGAVRKICPGSGKLVAAETPAPATEPPRGKDLRALMTRDVHKVIFCAKNSDPRIDVLTLDYLDKSERVRIQIEALREMLGADFQMREYPPTFKKPHLAIWQSAEACVVAARHDRGGFQSIADGEIAGVVEDLRSNRSLFFS